MRGTLGRVRAVAAIGLALLCLAACGRRPAPMRIRYADLINVDVRDVPLLMAADDLESKGYTIEKVYLSSSAITTDLLVRGEVDIAMINNQTVWTAIAKGADLRTVGPFTATTGVVGVTDAIRTCQDLDGKSVGVPSSAGLSPLLFRTYLSRHCPGSQPQLVVLPESNARADALLAGRLDAALLPGEEVLKLQRQGIVPLHVMYAYASEFPDVQAEGLHVRREWAAQHVDAIKDFLRAQLLAYRRVIDRPQVLFDESMKRLSIDADTAKAVGGAHLAMHIWDGNGLLTAENVQSTIDFLIKANTLPAGTQTTQVADLSYLNAVLDEIGRVPR
ncbi:MAG TPA: ABC transporter substrate-binding protein [Gemmatimonadaceae bacterium]|nr:ABC transporter substrate-binding protein [Gemmatimonadaceae bacterium]